MLRPAPGDPWLLGVLAVLGVAALVWGEWLLSAPFLVLALGGWGITRGRIDIGPSELTVRHGLHGTTRLPRAAVTAVRVGRDLDPEDALVLPPDRRRPVTLLLRLSEPVTIPHGAGERTGTALAFPGVVPEEAAAALGVPIDERPAPPRLQRATAEPAANGARRSLGERGSLQERLVGVLVAGLLVAVGHALLGGDEDANGEVFEPVPAVPGALAAYGGFSPDGAFAYVWRTSARALRVRVDTLAHACSGAAWTNAEHTVDLRGLRVGPKGAFRRRARVTWRYAGGVDVVTADLRGVAGTTEVRGTLVRTDDYRGTWQGICRRTIRFAARPR